MKMKKPDMKSVDLRRVTRIATLTVALVCVAAALAVGFFIMHVQRRITAPNGGSGEPAHVETTNDALLDRLTEAQTAKTSDARKLEEPIANPFAQPAPPPEPEPAPAETSQPAPAQ